jgi:hypothetical protein
MTIFVSIAAYRDPELVPTLHDCIARARHPRDLRFGICWQHSEQELRPAIFDNFDMRVVAVPWRDSAGACWARAEVMKLWSNEDFFLQIDSHHRFVQDWDAKLLAHAERSGAAKPLLTTYGAPFDPAAPLPPGEPMQMDFDRFTEDAIPLFRPRVIPGWQSLDRPLAARFLSGHFLFAPGSFVTEVPYDPELYFHGEEISLSIRAFTSGYALFHPPEHILWHEYTRAHRNKHWDDHVRANGVAREWHQCDAASRQKVRRFLSGEDIGAFGCGAERRFAEYEAYAGLSFAHRAAQDATLRGDEPPNAPTSPDWPTELREWQVRIPLIRAALPSAAVDDPQFWYVGFHDADNSEIHRQDVAGLELQELLGSQAHAITVERRFISSRRPTSWTVWPVASDGAWLEKTVGALESTMLSVARKTTSA